MKKRITVLFLTMAVLLQSGCSLFTRFVVISGTDTDMMENMTILPENFEEGLSGFYYEQLSPVQKEYYACFEYIALNDGAQPYLKGEYSNNDGKRAFNAFVYDNPQYYYMDRQYTYTVYEGKGFTLAVKHTYMQKSRDEYDAVIKNAVDEIKALTAPCKNDYEKELFVHDYLIKKVTYLDEWDSQVACHTLIGVFVMDSAVCDGYALAYKYILNELGIDCEIVLGITKEESGEWAQTGHAWNMVQIDGKYYGVDVTHDDYDNDAIIESANGIKREIPSHAFFNITDEKMFADRKIDDYFFVAEDCFSYPECVSDDADFYTVSGSVIDSYDKAFSVFENQLSDNLKDGFCYVEFRCINDVAEQTVNDAFFSVLGKLGNYSQNGTVYGEIEKGAFLSVP